MEFIDLGTQYEHISENIKSRIHAVLQHGAYIMGPEVAELESALESYVGVKHCITCANGTDALQLALMALNIGPGDAVFTTPFTFFATAEAISVLGATPVFVDIDESTYNLSPENLEDAIRNFDVSTGLTPKAVIAVNLFGLPADYEKIEPICEKYGLKLIEDAAQGFGGEINGRKACGFGDVSTTSFFPAKPLGCYGDGGALFTNDDKLAEVLRSLRVHGKGSDKYDNVRIGMNSRLDTIQAAILLEKLSIFSREVDQRNEVACRYLSGLPDQFVKPYIPEGFRSSWAQFTLMLDSTEARETLASSLKLNDIPSAVYYPISLHQQTAYKGKCVVHSAAMSEKVASRVLSLPMSPYLKKSDQEAVIQCLSSISETV